MATHTAGPWRSCGADRGGCVCGLVWNLAGDFVVAQAVSDRNKSATDGHGVKYDSEEFHANARLIAAAPDLLEACKAALPGIDDHYATLNPIVAQLQAAIDKATKGT